jgi:hypothetical protein
MATVQCELTILNDEDVNVERQMSGLKKPLADLVFPETWHLEPETP